MVLCRCEMGNYLGNNNRPVPLFDIYALCDTCVTSADQMLSHFHNP